MRKRTYVLIKETGQLFLIIGTVILLTISFYLLSRASKTNAKDEIIDEEEVEAMRDYHQLQSKNEIIVF